LLSHVSSEQKETRGFYENGKQAGKWTVWGTHPESLERIQLQEDHYQNGHAHGWRRRWHVNGQLAEEGPYIDGQKDGTWRQLSTTGEVVFKGEFDRGIPVGTHVERYLNGKIAAQRHYDELGRPDGEWCFWQANGIEAGCTSIEDGTGTMREFDESGRLAREYELKEGKLHGLLVDHLFQLGRYEASYREGEQHGPERVLRDECVERETMWANGLREGPHTEVSCDGPPVELVVGQHCRGEPCGRWIHRSPDTGLKTSEFEYSASGELVSEVKYDEHEQSIE
jgi:antitoxin component YwqK of YwqJK toxin-antitoxin module